MTAALVTAGTLVVVSDAAITITNTPTIAELNAIAAKTTGVVTATLAANSLANLGALTTAGTDLITVTVNDDDATAVTAANLSVLGGKTAGVVTVSNEVAISGTTAEMIAALVTAETKVTASSSSLTISDTPTSAQLTALDNATTGTISYVDNGQASFSINGTAAVGNTLSIKEDSSDPDGNGTLSYSWQTSSDNSSWSVVGTNATYTVGASEEGKSIKAVISYQDGQGFDETVTTSAASIPYVDNGQASFSINGTAAVGNTLSIKEDSSDPDGNGTLSYSWQTSSDNSSWSVVGTNATYTVGASEEGKSIKAVISYQDGQGFDETVTTSAASIPYVDNGQASFSINGTAAVGNTLSIKEDSSDPDGNGTLSYSWQTSSDNSSWSVVGTNATYTVGASEEGKSIKAVISYQDGQGFDETVTTSAASIPYVDNGQASFSINGTAAVGNTLSIKEDSSDPDGNGTLSYSWQTSSDNSSWSVVGTNATYTVGASEEGKSIKAVISYQDGQGFDETVTTSAASIPYVDNGQASFSINGTAAVGNTLSIKEDSSDPDGNGTLSYSWQTSSDNSSWSVVGTNATYTVGASEEGKSIKAVISYQDGQGFDETVTTSAASIPYVDNGQASFSINGTAAVGNTLSIKEDSSDPDGNGTLSYSWQTSSDNSSWSVVGTNATYTVGASEEGKSIKAVISYQDGQGFDETVTTSAASIPYVDNGQASFSINGTAAVGNTLSIKEDSSDPDGNGTLSYSWQTSSDNSSWSVVGTNATYTVGASEEGKSIKAVISYQDGQGFDETVTTSAASIPYVDNGQASFSINGTAAVGNTLSIKEDSSDPDGNGTLSYSWQTSSDNSSWSVVGTNATYTVGASEEGKSIKAVISYQDGQGFDETVTTSAASIPYVDNGQASFSINGTAAVGNTLSIEEDSADPDGSGTLSYSWQTSSDNSSWSVVGTNATYTVGASEEGKSIKAVISYQDGQGFDETVTTSAASIPYVDNGQASFSINGTAAVGNTLSIKEDSADPDGNGTLSYSWQTSSDNSSWR